MAKQEFLSALEDGLAAMRKAGLHVTLVHHNDADGLASAAIMQTALNRADFSVNRIPLERVHPPIIERIHRQFPSTILYVDLGAKGAPAISEVNHGQRFTLILDHHHPEDPTDPNVLSISTEYYGLSGDLDISAATAAYLFALTLDTKNRDLAYLGVIGSVGDAHDRQGRLIGENREALDDAMQQGQVRIETTNGNEHYSLTMFGVEQPITPLAKSLTTLGAAGYYMDGPAYGVKLCLEGPSQEIQQKFEELNQTRQAAFDKTIHRLRQDGLRETAHIQWFTVGEDFVPMGVKMIGEFCMEIRNKEFVSPEKYLVGFQTMMPEIPGLGTFDWSSQKVSMRLPSPLEKRVLIDKEMPGLAYLVPAAARQVGGSIDACHDYAAATVIDTGKETALIEAMESLIENH